MANTDITLTKIVTKEQYDLLEEGVNGRSPYLSEIPDPKWVFDETKPEITEAPLIANPITNQEHVINWIAKSYLEPLMKNTATKNIADIEKAARDSIKL